MRIGILGGTFDPIHLGHLIIAEEARQRLALDEVIFIPTGLPYMKAGVQISDARHRMAMVRLAIRSNPYFKASAMEIERPGPTYTVDTLMQLRERLPPSSEVFFILGLDSLKDFPQWREPWKILELCTLVAVTRPGFLATVSNVMDAFPPGMSDKVLFLQDPQIDISGTDIRKRVASGSSIRYQVPPAIEAYIRKHGLYKGGSAHG